MEKELSTISNYLKIITEDEDIQELINKSEILKLDIKTYKRRNSKVEKSKAGIIAKLFWKEKGAELRFLLEQKYKARVNNNSDRSRIKDALIIHLNKRVIQDERE